MQCLDLVKEESSKLQKYYDLLSALSMLHEFGISMLPIVLRNTVNYVPIVQKILNLDTSNYKNARKILRMIKLVNPNSKVDEAPILKLIADFAIQAGDYDYSLSICDMMMANPSPQACQVCLTLVNCDDFTDTGAKTKLASFCVNFCEIDDIEDMLIQRINLSDEIPELDLRTKTSKQQLQTGDDPENTTSVSDAEPEMKDALSKLTESKADPVVQMIPEAGTKVISSLFGKLSKFNPILVAQEALEESAMDQDDEEFMSAPTSPAKKSKQIAINAFYEDVFDHARVSQMQSNFESFSESIKGPLDKTTLALLSRHYRNALELDEEDQIEWSVLKDILTLLVEEDTALGVSLIVSQLYSVEEHFDLVQEFLNNPKRLPIGTYSVTLRTALDFVQDSDVFLANPGVLYSSVKSLHDQGSLSKKELFAKVLEVNNCDEEEDEESFE